MFSTRRRARFRRRRSVILACVVGAVLALGVAVGATASSGNTGTRLFAYVVPANTGTQHVGDTLWSYLYVVNANRPTNSGGSRMTLPNTFVVEDVNLRAFVDGTEWSNFTFLPPPNVQFAPWAGRWPSTVTCEPGTPPPCNVVGQPAVIPGENTVVFFPGWAHAENEPNGTYVFKYTVHGTQNGAPVELTATTPPIEMVD